LAKHALLYYLPHYAGRDLQSRPQRFGTLHNENSMLVRNRGNRATILSFTNIPYTKIPMGLKQVKKLESAAQVLISAYEEEGRKIPKRHLWLVSTGGFAPEVLTYINSRKDIYASDYEGINSLFKAYGGNYSIPQFAVNDK
jgi:hypothetical protein